ncbi:MAG: FISUMP domain-containing protein [bacterium]
MKRSSVLCLLWLSFIYGYSQTQTVTLIFHGEDSITHNPLPLESVYILNTTVGCDTTINGATPSIVLTVPLGMWEQPLYGSEPFILMAPIPNPFNGKTCVQILLNQSGTLQLKMINALGDLVLGYTNDFNNGLQKFEIESSVNGFMLLNVSFGNTDQSVKLINYGNGIGENRITFLGTDNHNLKLNSFISGFTFRFGEQLSFTSFKNGYTNKIILDSPTQDTSYTFELTPIITPTVPSVITNNVTNITQTTAKSGGNVTSDGGASVTARGVCWSTSSNPTTANSHTINGMGIGSFVSTLSGLTANMTYYVRAYATNSVGTGYGNQIVFLTLPSPVIPIVTTASVTNIAATSVTSGGNVISDGGTLVTARGVCWSTSSNPTIDSSHTIDGSGIGIFVSELTGLSPNTLYHIRAYATNSVGTGYGSEVTFTSLPSFICGSTVDYEGKLYNTIQIGTQCWFKENLNVGIRINGTQNQMNNGLKEKYCYDDLETNCDIYGGLYQWNEMMQYVTNEGIRGICPIGWHIPTDAQWDTLRDYLGGEFIAGGKMKETGTEHWAPPNVGATNSSGFTALPGGYTYSYTGSFNNLTFNAFFWSSSQHGSPYGWLYILYNNYADMFRWDDEKGNGMTVRCLQN